MGCTCTTMPTMSDHKYLVVWRTKPMYSTGEVRYCAVKNKRDVQQYIETKWADLNHELGNKPEPMSVPLRMPGYTALVRIYRRSGPKMWCDSSVEVVCHCGPNEWGHED